VSNPNVRHGVLEGEPVVNVLLDRGGPEMALDAVLWPGVVKRWGPSWRLVRGATTREAYVARGQLAGKGTTPAAPFPPPHAPRAA
jgi:hypothetical protein